MLDEFQVILHSSDSIAPVGVLHPLKFHLESKKTARDSDTAEIICLENKGSVIEVHGDSSQTCDSTSQSVAEVTNLIKIAENRLHVSKTQKGDLFSMACWLRDSSKSSSGSQYLYNHKVVARFVFLTFLFLNFTHLFCVSRFNVVLVLQEELTAVLSEIESRLVGYGFGWEDVLYIHLYVADMKEFAVANETYLKFIKQEKCPFGVPSRSTIELPLSQVGLGSAYMEVLVANDHTKRVLHVQSISSWAPSCIGPYSQVHHVFKLLDCPMLAYSSAKWDICL